MAELFWRDSFNSLGASIDRLSDIIKHEDIDRIEYMRDATIQRFEFVIELYWKVLKKILAYEKLDTTSPRDVLSKAFQFKLIDDEAEWLAMLDDRNRTSHIYREEEAKRIFSNIKNYLPVLEQTYQSLKGQYEL